MGKQVKRVPLDFDWPLNKVWDGFRNPHQVKCEACNGRGATTAHQRLEDLVSLLMLSGGDAFRGRHHPYFDHIPLHHTAGIAPSADMVELTTGLAGRGPSSPFGHDAIDRYSATRKIIAAAGLPKEWGTCPACNGEGMPPDVVAAHNAWEETQPPVGDGWQMWETVSEGSPISPVFETPEALAEWLGDRHAETATSKQWLAMILGGGWAPSFVAKGGLLRSGVAALSDEKG